VQQSYHVSSSFYLSAIKNIKLLVKFKMPKLGKNDDKTSRNINRMLNKQSMAKNEFKS